MLPSDFRIISLRRLSILLVSISTFWRRKCARNLREILWTRAQLKYIDITFQIPSGHSTQYLIVSCVPRSFCDVQIYLCKLIQIDLFGCFSSWKFKLQKVLGNEILHPEFTLAVVWFALIVLFTF